jgi:acyl transferase domain-containing protein
MEGASALAFIMIVVLAIEAGEVPPTFGVENQNIHIDSDGAKVTVVKDEAIPWLAGQLRRASVNSFGFGGANSHCIIDHVNIVLPEYVGPGIIEALPTTAQLTNSTWSSPVANSVSNGSSEGALYRALDDASDNSSNGFIMDSSLNRHISNGHPSGNGSPVSSEASNSDPSPQPRKHSPVTSAPKTNASAEATTRQIALLPFSAHNTSSLQLNIQASSNVINQHSLADIAYTLGTRRPRIQSRLYRIVNKDSPEHV